MNAFLASSLVRRLPIRVQPFHFSIFLTTLTLALTPALGHAQLTRQQAVAALLMPGSGVDIHPDQSVLWSPFTNFGAGAGFEGLLPAGAQVGPVHFKPGEDHPVTRPSYFFWIDDEATGRFAHDVRFVLVAADVATPTVNNGGIVVFNDEWWPVVVLPDNSTSEHFATSQDRLSPNPPGFNNPEGWVAGDGEHSPASPPPPLGGLGPMGSGAGTPAPANRACALILRGANDVDMVADVARFEMDLTNHFGVPPGRVIKVNNGNAATCAQFEAGISNLCAWAPDCDKIYIRIVSHGGFGELLLADEFITARTLCRKLQPLAAKGVPVCLVIDACRSGTLLDARNWNFPTGSSVIAASRRDEIRTALVPWPCFVGTNVVSTNTLGSFFNHAFHECLNDPRSDVNGDGLTDDGEALRWMELLRPCYRRSGNARQIYPAGPPPGVAGRDPDPVRRVVGHTPFVSTVYVRNGSDTARTDFHLTYDGRRTNILRIPQALRTNPDTSVIGPWATNGFSLTHNPSNNTTMVCWEDASDPIGPGEHIKVTVADPIRRLRFISQHWTPTSIPAAPDARAPGQRAELIRPDDGAPVLRVVTGEQVPDELEPPQSIQLRIRYSQAPIPVDAFHLADPAVADLPATELGTLLFNIDEPQEFELFPPAMPAAPLPTLILETHASWTLNDNTTTQLEQYDLTLPGDETICLTNCPCTTIFLTVNPPSGSNLAIQWYKDGVPIDGATSSTLTVTLKSFRDGGTYTGLATTDSNIKRRFFKVVVEDLESPVFDCPANITLECNFLGGAIVNYPGVTLSDNCPGSLTLECEPPSGSFLPVGQHTVACIARDAFQNSSVCSFIVTVQDTFPPQVFCPDDITIESDNPVNLVYNAGAFDTCDTNVSMTIDPPPGSTFQPDTTTTVTVTGIDSSGNSATCTFDVVILGPGSVTPLSIDRLPAGAVRVSWEDPSALLQGAPDVTGPWLTVPDASSPLILDPPFADNQQFFRLMFPDIVPDLIADLADPDPFVADTAYFELFSLAERALEPLIITPHPNDPYSGIGYQNPRSSVNVMDPLPVSLVSIYLIEAILAGIPQPHFAPVLVTPSPAEESIKLQQATQRYQEWWSENAGLPLNQLRLIPRPLDGTGMRWHGPIFFDVGAPEIGIEVPNSATPFRTGRCLSLPDGPDPGTDPDPYSWILAPRQASGPAPYNCLAWAVNCYNDRWVEPIDVRVPTNTWERVLSDHGYDVAGGAGNCEEQCPDGQGPKIKMIWHVAPGEQPNDSNWVHAMKQENDAQWTSKNGQTGLYQNIGDCQAFLDKHYPTPSGQTRVVRCYCK